MKILVQPVLSVLLASAVQAQIQVDVKFKRLQYIAHEPVIATVRITNLAGRAIDLHGERGQAWFGFEVNAGEGRSLVPLHRNAIEPALRVEMGNTVTRKINLTPIFPVHDLGTYHVRANVYFADLNQFFYSPTKVFQVADARPIWQRTVGIPDGMPSAGEARTYSLLSYRFPDHTSLYVRAENKDRGVVYATYSLGRFIAYDQPQVELDRANQLHVLHCAAPRTWAYSHVGPDGQLLAQSTFLETKTRPRLRSTANGVVAVRGGSLDHPAMQSTRNPTAKLSGRPVSPPFED